MLKRTHPTRLFLLFMDPKMQKRDWGKEPGKARPMAAGTGPIHGLEIRRRL